MMKKRYLFNSPVLLRDYDLAIKYIVSVGFICRLVWALLVSVDPVSDSYAYETFARNIVNYGVFGWTPEAPSAFWPVGTSAIYAFFFYFFDDPYFPIVLFNILIGLGIIIIGMRVARHFFGDEVAILTGIILAVWPSLVLYVTILASELPFMLLTLAAMDVWINPRYSVVRSAIGAGVLLAAASYIRPIALLLPIVFAFTFAIYAKQWRANIIKVVVVVLMMVILITPWSVRNYNIFGHFVVISTNGPVTLWMGNHPGTDGAYADIPEWAKLSNEYDRSKIMGERAFEYIKSDMVGFTLRSFGKLILQHSYETIAVTWNENGISKRYGSWLVRPLKGLCQAYWFVILAFSFAGLFMAFRDRGVINTIFHPLLMPWLYFSTLHAIILAQDRYHFPSIPFIAMFSAYALSGLIGHYITKSYVKSEV